MGEAGWPGGVGEAEAGSAGFTNLEEIGCNWKGFGFFNRKRWKMMGKCSCGKVGVFFVSQMPCGLRIFVGETLPSFGSSSSPKIKPDASTRVRHG